jgi:pyruvate/2-oxoacid:ferredoxin oxidoreductase beta subunit
MAVAMRHILNTLGPNTMAVAAPSCAAIICGMQPCSSLKIPVFETTLESSAAAASGIRRALNAKGKHDTTVIAFAGDGGTYDIGFQALSSAVERNEDMIYFCMDNEGYMNTGGQKSSATRRKAIEKEKSYRNHGRPRNSVRRDGDACAPPRPGAQGGESQRHFGLARHHGIDSLPRRLGLG